MLKTYVVEPELFHEWSDFKYLHEKFGFSKGRLIVAFPSKWSAQVYAATANFSVMHKKKVELWLQKNSKECFLVKGGYNYDSEKDWLSNAEEIGESNTAQLHAILACNNPRNSTKVILAKDESLDEHDLFVAPRGCFIPQTPQGYIEACNILLKYAKEITLVDPYFGTGKGWTETVEALLSCIPPQNKAKMTILKFQNANENGWEILLEDFKEKYAKFFLKKKYTHCSVKVVMLERDKNKEHNRYILTESGGIIFPWGLECLGSNKEDMVSLLEKDAHEKLRSEYMNFTGRKVLAQKELYNNHS